MEATLLQAIRFEDMIVGASGDVLTVFVPDPMCMQMTVPVSSQARMKGFQ
jgi:hypothetical protein